MAVLVSYIDIAVHMGMCETFLVKIIGHKSKCKKALNVRWKDGN